MALKRAWNLKPTSKASASISISECSTRTYLNISWIGPIEVQCDARNITHARKHYWGHDELGTLIYPVDVLKEAVKVGGEPMSTLKYLTDHVVLDHVSSFLRSDLIFPCSLLLAHWFKFITNPLDGHTMTYQAQLLRHCRSLLDTMQKRTYPGRAYGHSIMCFIIVSALILLGLWMEESSWTDACPLPATAGSIRALRASRRDVGRNLGCGHWFDLFAVITH